MERWRQGELRDSRSQQHVEDQHVRAVEEAEAWILAWWRDSRKVRSGGDEEEVMMHNYSTHVKPSRPLAIGGRVRLLAFPKAAPTTPGTDLSKFKTYDPHVVGVVARIEEGTEGWARVTILNQCRGNAVKLVELDIVYVPNETIQRGTLQTEEREPRWEATILPQQCIAHPSHISSRGHHGHHGHHGDGRERAGGCGRARRDGRGESGRAGDEQWAGNEERAGNERWAGNGGRTERNGRDGDHRDREERTVRIEHGGRNRDEGERSAQLMCGAEECGLDPMTGENRRETGRTWNVMEKRVRKEVPKRSLEGTLRLHMWLRYDWAT